MGLIEKISKKTMKWVIKRKGLGLCRMCDDAIATEMNETCKECYEELWLEEMAQYYKDEMEATQ
jgi:hypothetical protein